MPKPSLLRDISPGVASSFAPLDGTPEAIAGPGGFWFFVLPPGSGTTEIWWSDGSSAGTRRLTAINGAINRPDAAVLNGRLIVSAATVDRGSEPLLIDSAGTVSRFDLNPAGFTRPDGIFEGEGSAPRAFRTIGDRVWFLASSSLLRGFELWTSDGTAAGTAEVKEISPGAGDSFPTEFTPLGSRVLFTAEQTFQEDPTRNTGRELWISDGTAAGTVLVRDICPGNGGSTPGQLTPFAGIVIFAANDGVNGYELWRTDGTTAGTFLLKDIIPGPVGGNPGDFTVVGERLFFSVGGSSTPLQLWVSDGTTAGTRQVTVINPFIGGGSRYLSDLTALGGKLYFFADDSSGSGKELWTSDGTAAGTRMVLDINPGVEASGVSRGLVAAGGRLWFAANDGLTGMELWSSDGTAAGTALVSDLRPGAAGSLEPRGALFTVAGDQLVFTADDGVTGVELWTVPIGTTPPPVSDPPPPAPTIANVVSLTDDVGTERTIAAGNPQDPRSSASPALINDPTPLLRGTLSAPLTAGQTIGVFNGSVQLGTATVDADPLRWSFQPSLPGTAGTPYAFEARVLTPGAAPTAPGGSLRVTLDTVAPAPRVATVGGSDLRITGVAGDRTVTGSGEAGREVRLFSGTTLLGTTVAGSGGQWSYELNVANLQALGGQGSGRSLIASQSDAAENSGSATSLAFTIDTRTATAARDSLLGLAANETFVLNRLSDSLLASYDVVTNFARGMRLDAPSGVAATTLNGSVGTVSSLSSSAIANLLSRIRFPANRAVAFQVRGVGGTFVAINDRNAGFSSSSDAILYLPTHSFSSQGGIPVI